MYAKSTRPSAKREVQKEQSAKRDVQKFRSAKRDDRIARPRRAQTCERSARWECAHEAGRFFVFFYLKVVVVSEIGSLEKSFSLISRLKIILSVVSYEKNSKLTKNNTFNHFSVIELFFTIAPYQYLKNDDFHKS